jgi:parallel beta-helix repeat protein
MGFTDALDQPIDGNYTTGFGTGSNCYTLDGLTFYSRYPGAVVNSYVNEFGVIQDLYFLATTTNQGPITLSGGPYNWIATTRNTIPAASFVDPLSFGANPDGQTVTGSITIGTATLNITTSTFVLADQGKRILVFGAGAAAVPLEATILTYVSPTQVILSTNALTTAAAQAVWFGTDNLTAIVDAITAAATLGFAVQFTKAGIYSVYGEITLAEGTIIQGLARPTLRQMQNNKNLITSANKNNIKVMNLKCIGLGITDSCGYGYYGGFEARGIHISYADDVLIANCNVSGFKNAGIISVISSNVRILNNDVVGVTPPDSTNHSFGIHVFANSSVDGRKPILIEGNTVNYTSQAIFMGPGYTNVRIVDNNVDFTAQHGMYLYADRGFVIEGNTITNAFYDGIKCQNTEVTTSNPGSITISNNIIRASRDAAWCIIIDIQKLTGEKRMHYEGVNIIGNVMTDSAGGGGIYVSNCRGANITGNTIKRMFSYGIFMIDSEGTIGQNLIHTTGWTGLYARPIAYGLITIQTNTLFNTATDGANGALSTAQRMNLFLEGSMADQATYGSAHPWAAATFYTVDEYVTASANIYKCVTTPGGTTSGVAPSHGAGTAVDGGVTWLFMSTAATLDAGEIHLKNNTVLLGASGAPQNSMYLYHWVQPLRFGWNNNILPLTKTIVAANQLMQFNWGNVHGAFTSSPTYTGEVGGMVGKEISSTAAPTTGTWVAGDKTWKRAPVEAGAATAKYVIIGWICVAGGTPGTWLEMRTLTGN